MPGQYDTATLMDIDFIHTTMDQFLNRTVYPSLANEEKCFIVTANPEFIIATRDHPDFKEVVQHSDYVLADGVGIINASRLMGKPLPERISGIDVMYNMLDYASKNGCRVFFLGAEEGANEKAVENAEEKFPGLNIVGRHDGYFDRTDETISDYVLSTQPDIVLVALGMKRQEGWIRDHIDKFDKGVFMGVGGSFDVLAGKAKRAPDIWIKLQLEWLYRLIKDPKRIRRVLRVGEFMLLHMPVVGRIMKFFGVYKKKQR